MKTATHTDMKTARYRHEDSQTYKWIQLDIDMDTARHRQEDS